MKYLGSKGRATRKRKTITPRKGRGVKNGRGFTISDQLSPHGITFNIPPFIEGRAQLPADKVRSGYKLLHCEYILRGLLEEYTILKGTLPLSMSRIANQIISVCAWLVNFHYSSTIRRS